MRSLIEKYSPLRNYQGQDGRFQLMPGKRQKKLQSLMIEYLSEQFDTERTYSEKEVNTILDEHHSFEDSASLRRFLIGHKMLARTIDGRKYWKTSSTLHNN